MNCDDWNIHPWRITGSFVVFGAKENSATVKHLKYVSLDQFAAIASEVLEKG